MNTRTIIILGMLITLAAGGLLASAQATHGVSAAWTPPVQVSSTAGNSSGVVGRSFAIDSRGVLHVVWVERSANNQGFDVYYAQSTDDGVTWSAARDLFNAQLPAYSPNLVTAPDDTLHLVWTDRRKGTAREFYSRSFDGGATWEAPRNISGDHTRDAGSHTISVDTQNRVHIAWHLGNPDEDTQPTEIYYVRSVDGGATWEAPRKLNTGSGHAAFPRFTVEGTSGDVLAIAWRDNRRNPDWDVYLAVSADGGASFTEKVGQATPQRDWDPEVMVDPAGVLHLSVMMLGKPGEGRIEYRQSTDLGDTWTESVVLNTADARFPFWAVSHPNGVMWLFWKDERDFLGDSCPPPSRCADIIGVYSKDGGQNWSEPEFVTDFGSIEVKFPSPILAPSGRPYMMWSATNPATGREVVYVNSRASAP